MANILVDIIVLKSTAWLIDLHFFLSPCAAFSMLNTGKQYIVLAINSTA
jgi:hypothetical protein